LTDELFAAFELKLPELTLPAEDDLPSAADLNRALLLAGARADILPQAGSQLSVVAALVAGDEGRASGEEPGESPLADLFISPLALAGLPAAAPGRPVAKAETGAAPEAAGEGAESGGRAPRGHAAAALVVLAAFSGVIVGLTHSERGA